MNPFRKKAKAPFHGIASPTHATDLVAGDLRARVIELRRLTEELLKVADALQKITEGHDIR